MGVKRLLEELRTRNATDGDDVFHQELLPAEPISNGIPLLAPGQFRDPTTMLRARFEFAGRWVDAWAGQTWLGLSDMVAVWNDKGLQRQIGIRRDNWEGSAPAVGEVDALSLFGVNREEFEETYLVWPKESGVEPEVWVYLGQRESRYDDLASYLRFLTT